MQCEKKRIDWIDMAKGYGILLVILGHLSLGKIMTWIYTFHMPLFFFLSGYVFSAKKDFGNFLKSKCRSLLIPYLCLGIPILLFCGILNYYNGATSYESFILPLFRLILQCRHWTIWFITALFFVNIFYYIAKKKLKTNLKISILAILLPCIGAVYYRLGGPALPWNIDTCLMAFPFFFIGNLYKEYHEAFDRYTEDKKTSVLLFFGFLTLNLISGYLSYKISGTELIGMFESSYGFEPFTYVAAFSGVFCIILLSKWFTFRPVRYLGENSLLYFAWHQSIMIPVSVKILLCFNWSIDGIERGWIIWAYKIVQMIIILTLLTICNMIISKTKLRFMLGKK